MTKLIDIAAASQHVAKVAPWKDRHYLNFVGATARCAGDRNLKIWIKGDKLTIEGAKGSRSTEFADSVDAFLQEIKAAGAVRKGYGDSIEATWTLA